MTEISADILSAAVAVDDAEVRRQGIGFVDGTIPGYVLLMGDKAANAPALIESLTERRIVVFVTEDELVAALRETGVSLGWESRVVPLDVTSALGFVTRVAQIFGHADTPDAALNYACERLRGFSALLGQPTPNRLTGAREALPFGCALLSNAALEPLVAEWDAGTAGYRDTIGGLALDDLIQVGIEERGLRIHVPLPELPVRYSEDFAGEVVRADSVGAALYGVELVVTGQDLVDGQVTVVGPDLDARLTGDHPYGLLIEVSGKAMQSDFENVLEREVESLLNEVNGVMHRGQRANTSLRISQKAIDAGLRLHHLGEILRTRYHNALGNILNRVQVTIITDPEQMQTLAKRAQAVYDQRDARLSGMTDEGVDTFYTCTLCQAISPSHICIISPEHVGVCGAMDWMDAQAAVSIRPVGPNQAVEKEGLLDARLGQWESVNRVARKETGGALESYSLYSMMESPGPACGDFECITAMLPLSNGVMVVNRAYQGLTPGGMDWDTLNELVGACMPVPGFIGHSKRALSSQKFIAGDGGWRRIVWMNHALREELRPALELLAAEAGLSGFVDMIATEQQATSEEDVLACMETTGHPALMMEPMM
ncbi:MAG TPA: CO dehydrogenase/CO-methylating acetyl-CoA synthase complex subunit beta [Chloroflexi bacterium]|nr:CO dehydrogenase/CO-methylating acetyl-CoA synthase complex subunit beta [Chloroflexota bacterium]